MARRGKKLSLDGSVPGVEHNRYHGGYNRSSFENQRQAGSSQPFEAYDPDPGGMELPDTSYEQYQWDMSCQSLALHLHQVGRGTCTSELPNMLGTPSKA